MLSEKGDQGREFDTLEKKNSCLKGHPHDTLISANQIRRIVGGLKIDGFSTDPLVLSRNFTGTQVALLVIKFYEVNSR